jgi:glycosyltransferase involved in cell wall biosynthesis
MRTPLISVVMPVRNGERYLSDALDSISTQTFSDFELLVIDDGSTDSTSAILAEFQGRDPRTKVHKNPGKGLVDALNYGVASATAPLIARMDADDICLPQRLQRQHDFLSKCPEIAVLGTQVISVDAGGLPIAKTPRLPHSPDEIAKSLLKGCCIRHPTVLFRREAFDRVGGYRNQLVNAEDYDLWLRIAEHDQLANLSEQLLLYRVHPDQVSREREWSQRLSRNLALLAALERRRTGTDLITSYFCFSEGVSRQQCRGLGCANRVCESVRAMGIAEKLVLDTKASLSREDGWEMLRYVSKNTIGDGKKPGHGVLMAVCREAARQQAPLLFATALGLALHSHLGRTMRSLAGNSRSGRLTKESL